MFIGLDPGTLIAPLRIVLRKFDRLASFRPGLHHLAKPISFLWALMRIARSRAGPRNVESLSQIPAFVQDMYKHHHFRRSSEWLDVRLPVPLARWYHFSTQPEVPPHERSPSSLHGRLALRLELRFPLYLLIWKVASGSSITLVRMPVGLDLQDLSPIHLRHQIRLALGSWVRPVWFLHCDRDQICLALCSRPCPLGFLRGLRAVERRGSFCTFTCFVSRALPLRSHQLLRFVPIRSRLSFLSFLIS